MGSDKLRFDDEKREREIKDGIWTVGFVRFKSGKFVLVRFIRKKLDEDSIKKPLLVFFFL